MNTLPIILSALGGLLIGLGIGYIIRKTLAKNKIGSAEVRAEKLIQETKNKQQEMLIEAKEKAFATIEEAKKDETTRRKEIQESQKRLENRESLYDQKLLEFQERQEKLEEVKKILVQEKDSIKQLKEQAISKLQEVAGLSREQAEQRLMDEIEESAKDALFSRVRKLQQKSEEELKNEANKILSLAITRMAASHVVETTTTNVELPSDEMKGRIIGKEGRNIKALELLTGCEIVVDETPEMILISGFSPIRRQIAKMALEELIKDGRIHPAKIEESVTNAKKNLAMEIKKAGEEALYEVGIPVSSIDPKLVAILGRMKFRSSYGQNALQHSLEVAHIATMLAEELGADVNVCKKGGLFHDIGKSVDHDMQGAHPEIGYNIMKKFGFPEEVAYQSIAHHEDSPRTIEGVIVKAADAISGARPGARKNTLEQYIQRLEELEKTAASFEGIEKVYAIQAGREVRVFVQPQAIDDMAAYELAKNIAKKIEGELSYPGEVKVTVIRETRVVEYAR
ncbi:MAG: hypothetical protein ACD_76C00024G0002 [uncultured bacterium]|nr:MAG: hypothetical protein ACD_76C00024G0002 [uncultured bacterium]HBD05372.1 ribonuclease Y [Candidatus Uhrbacteria bacterium]